MTQTVDGRFEVSLTPQPAQDAVGDETVLRMAIEKRFHGGIEGQSRGEMLATRTEVDGSAGYVAIERFVGSVDGRSGTFALQHSGTANRGAQTLSVKVIPDSGTGDLVGLSGTMDLTLVDDEHRYAFDYELAPSRPAGSE